MPIQFLATDEQTMLRDSVRRWAEQAGDGAGATCWPLFAEMGWLMASLPEDAGGLGGNAYDAAIVAEELGYRLIDAPFVETGVTAAQALLPFAPDRVARIADGSWRAILAHDEAGARGDPLWVETRAEPSGDGWRLTGRKTGLFGAMDADGLLVTARIEGEDIALFEMPGEGAPLRPFTALDGRSAAELRLDATPATLVARDGVRAAIAAAADHALILESAEALGAMQRAMEMTRDYLLTRRQYGKLIGEFQALRHRLADMFIEVEQARSIILRGLAALCETAPGETALCATAPGEAAPAERARIAAAVRARVAQAGSFVGANAVQLHGGIGVTDEYPVGRYFKRLLVFETRHGGCSSQVERVARLPWG